MHKTSTKKNIFLLAIGALLALHFNLATAGDKTTNIESSGTEEECVITDDRT